MTQLRTTDKGFRVPEAEASQVRTTAGAINPPLPAPAVTYLELPCPPSVNALWRNAPRRGRVETQLYKDWKGHAGWRLREQRPEPIHGEVLVVFNIERTSDLADVDNRIKATLDLLVDHQVIDDDRFVSALAVAWSPPGDALVRLAIIPASPLTLQFQLASDGRHGGWSFPAPQPEPEYL